MYRLGGMTDVNNVSYNPANQLLTMTCLGIAETRGYNMLNQLTSLSSGSTVNSNYSGPFTSMNIGAGVITASLAMSSNGLQNPFALTPPTVVSGGVQTPGASATYGTTYYSNAVNVGNLNSVLTQAVVGALGPLGAAIESYYGIYQGLCGK
jgi:hypothetical protein